MSDRPDLDEAINILQNGGWNIIGGKYAPKPNTPANQSIEEQIHYLTEAYIPTCKDDVIKFEQAIKQLITEELENLVKQQWAFNGTEKDSYAVPTRYIENRIKELREKKQL